MESLQAALDQTLAFAERFPGEIVVVPYSLVSNQRDLAAGYATGFLTLVTTGSRGLPRRRLERRGEMIAGSATPDTWHRVVVHPPELRPGGLSGWILELAVDRAGSPTARVPIEDGPVGVATGVGPGVGSAIEACYLLALGRPGLESPRPR
ncbi:hypothetical protein [Microbacterium sp. bgisy189]|uniref:hypothetical protein n=1 Tax=Microbacterium sp. bgisy189 TaxID=3413798 RepID=UPI003EBDE83A